LGINLFFRTNWCKIFRGHETGTRQSRPASHHKAYFIETKTESDVTNDFLDGFYLLIKFICPWSSFAEPHNFFSGSVQNFLCSYGSGLRFYSLYYSVCQNILERIKVKRTDGTIFSSNFYD
jgi:hypothetical protein